MDILLILFLILGLLSILILFPIHYRNGELLNNKIILTSILTLIIIIGYFAFMSLPSNYLLQKLLVTISTLLGILAYILKLIDKSTLMVIRILLTLSLISNFILLILKI